MADSNRGYFIVAALVAVVTAGTFGATESRCQREQSAYRGNTNNQSGRKEITQFRSDRAWIPCLVERAIANPETPGTTEHDQRDLVAQEGAALWGFWIAVISFFQLAFGGIGLWALLRTLKQGQESIQASRDSTKVEQRAWIKFVVDEVRGPESYRGFKRFLIRGVFTNIGQTPALNVIYWSELCFDKPEESLKRVIEEVKLRPLEGATSNVFPADTLDRRFGTGIDEERRAGEGKVEGMPDRMSNVWLLVIVQYQTVFGPMMHYTAKAYRIMSGGLLSTVDFEINNTKDELRLFDANEAKGYID
jgi:hypothetical protein